MANGFMPYLLEQSKDVFLNATPSRKITPPGFLKMLLNQDSPEVVSMGLVDAAGHMRDVHIKYRQRVPAGKSRTSPSCDIDAVPSYSEMTIPALLYREYTVHLDDEIIAHYEDQASRMKAAGKPASEYPQELWDVIIEAANGLFADINSDLVTGQAAAFGTNIVSGSAAAKAINFPLNNQVNDLTTGFTAILNDAMENEINLRDCSMVGAGLINAFMMQQRAKSADFSGLNTAQLEMPNFYYDPATATGWGPNEFGIFEKNAVQLVNVNKYKGDRAGDKMIAKLGTLTLPVADSLGDASIGKFTFDYRLQYNACLQDLAVGGNSTPVDEGWILTLKSYYNAFNIPADAYDAADRLYGNNGSLVYQATNA